LRVLVVDNEEDRWELIRLALDMLGHVAEQTSSHSEAVTTLAGPHGLSAAPRTRHAGESWRGS